MAKHQAVAIVAIGAEFPGADSLARFWENVSSGHCAASEPPEGRWLLDVDEVYAPEVGKADHVYSRKACFLADEVDKRAIPGLELDADFLEALDPMFRLLLRVGHQTLKDARSKPFERSRAGIIIGNLALPSEKSSALAREFLGKTFSEKLADVPPAWPEAATHPLNHFVAGLPAGLLAKTLGFHGSCFTLDAACASSLYAVKLACDELLSGRADAMLAGGLSRPDSLYTQMGFSQLRALSPDGVCSPFDAKGNGLVVGEGCGLVLLKRLEDALRDGDQIYAVIRGAGLSNDRSGNLLAPSSEGQLRAMQSAYREAGWTPDSVDHIECHATGTPVGDAVEFASLRQLWHGHKGHCVLGSVKANIGHLLTAAGSAALIKTLLALKHKTLPQMANFSSPAADVELENSPFRILSQSQPWERRRPDTPRRAAVSAFGFGGINAHLLLEEWMPEKTQKGTVRHHPAFQPKPKPLAIVGMAVQLGGVDSLGELEERLMQRRTSTTQPPDNWWGAENSSWLKALGYSAADFAGYRISEVSAQPGEFRIPPNEVGEILPRQLLMLKVAANALKDAGIDKDDHPFTGVYIGCGIDLNATNFSFRWGLSRYARDWAGQFGFTQNAADFQSWLEELRDQAGPPLTANRTMGALGSTVASRIAKEFHIGGPSFTLSSEENSGLKALETAFHALQSESINRALVGSVELAGELRAALCRQQLIKDKNEVPVGEGAVALVLKRLDDARRDGDRIYALLDNVASANAGDPLQVTPVADALNLSLERTLRGLPAGTAVSHVELASANSGSARELELVELKEKLATPFHLGWISAATGYAGAVSGLAAVVKSALMLKAKRLLPSESEHLQHLADEQTFTSSVAQYWLTNKVQVRRALVGSLGSEGSCSHALLSEDPQGSVDSAFFKSPEQLFVFKAENVAGLQDGLGALRQLLTASVGQSLQTLASRWYRQRSADRDELPVRLSLIASDAGMLAEQLDFVEMRLSQQPSAPIGFGQDRQLRPALKERVFYAPEALADKGKLAFIFPGSGNHYAEMGSELSALWPGVYARQELENRRLADQYLPWLLRREQLDGSLEDNHNALVISHVALCTALSDLVRSFGIEPRLVSGYSLGESSGLFATRAWRDRDAMLQRLESSRLFVDELGGPCKAARRIWNLPKEIAIDWHLGIVNLPEAKVREALQGKEQVYLLIVNSYREVVIGGNRSQVEALVGELGCHFIPLTGVTTVHCEVVNAVADAYRSLHMFQVYPPQGIDYYSCALGKKYPLTSSHAADVILAQAQNSIDYPRVVEKLYADGARIFIEVGPGNSCSRMIDSILEGREHLAVSTCVQGQDAALQILALLGRCFAQGVKLQLDSLFCDETESEQLVQSDEPVGKITLITGGKAFLLNRLAGKNKSVKTAVKETDIQPSVEAFRVPSAEQPVPAQVSPLAAASGDVNSPVQLFVHYENLLNQQAHAHETYLNFSRQLETAVEKNIALQMQLLRQMQQQGVAIAVDQPLAATSVQVPVQQKPQVVFDRAMCLEFATGSVARMLGPEFAEVDSYPTRVRLPDEPLMLVDRIVALEGEARSLSHGRVVTEHDVTADRWYLDGGRIPTCVAVEAGQADLFLSGYLGIDFISKGKAVYRLLDAVVTFHRSLPVPGDVIRYDIKIERFFRQDQTYLFKFNFEGTVNGEPLLSMRDGCAGFFTAEELAAGKGIVHTRLDLLPQPGKLPDDWREPVVLKEESYSAAQIDALYRGELATCFGAPFDRLPLQRPYTLPGGKLKLVDRVTKLDPRGGRYGLGQIRAEMDIDPGDWFLTCHFVDDRVMPGTLMYECCMHTLRIFLLRLGWVGEEGTTWCEPVPGVASGLKCRGQVTEETKTVTYQVSIKELGYRPEPYAIVDALMYADGKAIVEIPSMSVQLAGLNRDMIDALWGPLPTAQTVPAKQVLYDRDRITAFAIGDPSYAFGEKYRIFDKQRRIARLPGPPFQFIDRIVAVSGEPWLLKAGATVEAEYDVPAAGWYFAAGGQSTMPFAVLLEIGLQPCGWLAAYLGSALTSEIDLSFRNLDGHAVQHRPVTAESGTLTIKVTMTRVSSSAGMIIQNYDFAVYDSAGLVYSGDTVFGFFSQASLAQQVGVRGAALYQPSAEENARAQSFAYPQGVPYPEQQLRMVDQIDHYDPFGGSHGLGFIRGLKQVDPEEWFFKAHFYQDPVCPGSLGLESYLQLLKVFAARRWGADQSSQFETVAIDVKHCWNYRGQIVPSNDQVVIEATITAIDDEQRLIRADGYLAVDGKVIYQLKDFSLRLD